MTRTEALAQAEYHKNKKEDLIEKYGEGVRPAYVSTELQMAIAYESQFRKLAEELKE